MLSKRNLKNVIKWPLALVAIMWIVFIVDTYLTGGQLSYWYGLRPNEIVGLKGILFFPFLHGGWGHLIANSVPFLSLSAMLIFFYPRLWPRILTTLWLGSGALLWLTGGFLNTVIDLNSVTEVHIGASGLIYALASFLAFSGIFRRDFRAIVVALIVLFYYGGMAAGVLPGQEGISWEGHLTGFLFGAFGGWLFRNNLEDHEIEKRNKDLARRTPRQKEHFLEPDAFTKTKKERAEEAERLKQEAFWKRLEKIKEEERLRR
ncbi:rhomboid family intramembrane serine protease [Neolewinella aurantiaca]|uniref:Rhomboid family intramembrane serine protease n=1 Tax=Neolewinella aurantiaca TaxID=2602767 RepID=A0A5C7FGQ6_9BACT|nr:rhomboid family intramembrane serine protease [Neolewinella aurantiaca]TXF89554.1 rhomboid family intramembrane serine protease [Neolewinella aurantiaca]